MRNTKLKFLRNYENEIFCSHPTPTQSAFYYSSSPPVCKKILHCGAAILLRDEDYKATILFHSVIYNSVSTVINLPYISLRLQDVLVKFGLVSLLAFKSLCKAGSRKYKEFKFLNFW